MTAATKKVGRKVGTLGENSLTAKILALKPGEATLMPDVGTHPHGNYTITIKRAMTIEPKGYWKLETCHGFAANMDSTPFKFYRITRIK